MEQQSTLKHHRLSLTYQEYAQKGNIQNVRIGNYSIFEVRGEGSYGCVHRAQNTLTQEEVAAKLIDIRKIKAEQNELLRAVKLSLAKSEPKLMHQCNSPFLLKCHEVFQNEDLTVLIVEYCNGKTLQEEIQERRRIPENEAWLILKHIISGLMVLHSSKIVHRDLKAENIMSHNGTYKIIDFGFSKKLQVETKDDKIKNVALGTVFTMAPQILKKKPYGLKADIWSLGIIFFQMVYGVYPYSSSDTIKLHRQILATNIFSKEEPLTINGYTSSKDAFNFMRILIVPDPDLRPSWLEVANYPNIKNASANYSNPRVISKVSQEVQKGFDYGATENNLEIEKKPSLDGLEEFESIDEKNQEYDTDEYRKRIQKEAEEKKKQLVDEQRRKEFLQKVEFEESEFNKKKTQSEIQAEKEAEALRIENQKEQLWIEEAQLECLKTQLIFREIIYPLKLSKVLDIEAKRSIEFYYLLESRCLNNMSLLKVQLEERAVKSRNWFLKTKARNQITVLFNQVHKSFLQIVDKLQKSGKRLSWILRNSLNQSFNKQNYLEKMVFLTKIQDKDYTKEEQILYTWKYYEGNIKEKLKVKNDQMWGVLKRMEHYKDIMMVSLRQLKEKKITFEKQVKYIISGGK